MSSFAKMVKIYLANDAMKQKAIKTKEEILAIIGGLVFILTIGFTFFVRFIIPQISHL